MIQKIKQLWKQSPLNSRNWSKDWEMEQYLAGSQDLQDLEYRMNKWNRDLASQRGLGEKYSDRRLHLWN